MRKGHLGWSRESQSTIGGGRYQRFRYKNGIFAMFYLRIFDSRIAGNTIFMAFEIMMGTVLAVLRKHLMSSRIISISNTAKDASQMLLPPQHSVDMVASPLDTTFPNPNAVPGE